MARFVQACRIDDCARIAVVPSTLCYEHIQRGKAALGLRLGYDMEGGPSWTNLYAIAGGPFVKLGSSNWVLERLKSLQTASPYELVVLGTLLIPKRVEFLVHAALADHWVRGEWFKQEGRCTEVVEAIRSTDYPALSKLIGIEKNTIFALSDDEHSSTITG